MPVDKFGRSGKSNSVITEGVSLSYIGNNFLRRDGTNTANGSINMTGNTLTNVSNPVNAQDIATKNYADTKMSTMMGDIQMTDNRITGLSDPVGNQDAATKCYVDNNRSCSLGATIFKQPLLEVGVTLENIPLFTEGTMSGGIMLADPINIHITNGGLFRIEICGNCVAPRPPVPGSMFFFNRSTLQRYDIVTNQLAANTFVIGSQDANLSVRCKKLAGRHLAYYTLEGNYV